MNELAGYKRDEIEEQPPYACSSYHSTALRAPKHPLVPLPHTLSEITGPMFGHEKIGAQDHDLTQQHAGEPLGERIIVLGRIFDSNGKPIPNTLMEIWQANSAGRYRHDIDTHPAPLDPNFQGLAKLVTGAAGEWRITTIKPRFYDTPLGLRTPHIHFDVQGSAHRLVTQMYFDDEPEQNAT